MNSIMDIDYEKVIATLRGYATDYFTKYHRQPNITTGTINDSILEVHGFYLNDKEIVDVHFMLEDLGIISYDDYWKMK